MATGQYPRRGKVGIVFPYPQSTFEALFVEAVYRRENLKEHVDALLVVEVGKLLEGLLDLFPQRFGLGMMQKKR